ncbi:MAG: TPR end-of-group domain-containing protein [Anaerolineales bacterium]
MDLKGKLVELLDICHQNENSFISGINEQEKNLSGTVEQWSVKDEIVHIAAWKGIMCERFRAFHAGQTPPEFDDWDAINEEIFHRHQEDSWSEAVNYLELSNRQLAAQVQSTSEEDLLDAERYPWLKGRSLWKRTLHNGYFHPHWHMAFWFSKHGELDRGKQLMETVTDRMGSLDESATWRGQSIYNLACYYALIGENERAVDRLGQAFALSADMVEWSREDSDLISLWDDPGYLALIERWKAGQ